MLEVLLASLKAEVTPHCSLSTLERPVCGRTCRGRSWDWRRPLAPRRAGGRRAGGRRQAAVTLERPFREMSRRRRACSNVSSLQPLDRCPLAGLRARRRQLCHQLPPTGVLRIPDSMLFLVELPARGRCSTHCWFSLSARAPGFGSQSRSPRR